MKKIFYITMILLAAACSGAGVTESGLEPEKFESDADGKATALYTLTNASGMEVCITNFEHLHEELVRLKARGCRAFVGCCCQQFFVKHAEDFAAIGLPGILVDIEDTTCYELGEENAAYKGRFARQTSVNMELLSAIFEAADRAGGGRS